MDTVFYSVSRGALIWCDYGQAPGLQTVSRWVSGPEGSYTIRLRAAGHPRFGWVDHEDCGGMWRMIGWVVGLEGE